MNEPREIIDPAHVGPVLAVVSVVALVAALALAARARSGKSAGACRAAWIVGLGALAFPLWKIYNGIEDHFGLDSVLALVLNVVLFAAVGITLGLVMRPYWASTEPRASDGISDVSPHA